MREIESGTMTKPPRSWGRSDTVRYLTAHIIMSYIMWDGIINERVISTVTAYLALTIALCHALWTAERITGCARHARSAQEKVDKEER